MKISYFITPHGFGHASRACAVMAELQSKVKDIQFQICTTVPKHVFEASGIASMEILEVQSDIGMVQLSPTEEDLPATVSRLNEFLQFRTLAEISERVAAFGPDLIVCDIAVMGILVGEKLSVPTVLIENFTWDWIYAGYLAQEARFSGIIERFTGLLARATYHIQAAPVCRLNSAADRVAPISRAQRIDWSRPVEIGESSPYVLISMGGVAGRYPFLDRLSEYPEVKFVVAGAKSESCGNLVRFSSADDRFYHPNLVANAALVVSKAGVSTVSEVYAAGVPFLCIDRPSFREGEVVYDFIQRENRCAKITQAQFDSGDWLLQVADLMNGARRAATVRENGAGRAAELIIGYAQSARPTLVG